MDDGSDPHPLRTRPRAVVFDHDGGIDDLLSLVMLLAMPSVELRGIAVTPADCFLRPALSATLKILRWFGRSDIPVAAGRLHGVNAFPPEWRAAPYQVDALPILNESDAPLATPVDEPADVFLARLLREASAPLTVLVTGPVTNLAAVLDAEPALAERVAEVVWMGGALAVQGNVRAHEHDGSAEWNAYWDPPAVARLWRTRVPITLVPLDATNQVPVTLEFLKRLARQRRHGLSDFAGQCWAMTVGAIPAYEYIYCMWDTLTAGYLGAPHMLTFQTIDTEV
ncbi:MAG TPA: nucleoside hydrolase, partial [Xanthomonadales bacterium]|nr:nucleoside hydrolase [Xanthomonadales bacterium]